MKEGQVGEMCGDEVVEVWPCGEYFLNFHFFLPFGGLEKLRRMNIVTLVF